MRQIKIFVGITTFVLIVILGISVFITSVAAENGNNPPVLSPIGDKQGQEGEWFVIPRIIATDPDDDTLTIQAANLPSGIRFFQRISRPGYVEYKLRWPDRFVKPGTYTPTFTVRDGSGGTDDETITVDIVAGNQSPEFSPSPIPEQYGTEGVEFNSEVITLTDPDGPNMNFASQNLPAGAYISSLRVSPPNLYEFRITWPAEHVLAGDYTVTFVANDEIAPQVSESMTIHIAGTGNHDPILRPIGDKSGQEGKWFVIPKIVATDPDNDTLTIQVANRPSGVRFFQITSRPGYVEYRLRWPDRFVKAGVYNVTFTTSDGNGGTDSETITITILGISPPSGSIDLGEDYPSAILWGNSNSTTAGGALQVVQGDIDGNGLADLISMGSIKGITQRYVGVFFDATLSSLNDQSFSDADFMVITEKEYPWKPDVLKDHPMHWIAVDDLNRDGYDDIIFGLPIIDLGSGLRDEKGEVYVVLGNTKTDLGLLRDFSVNPPDFTFFGKDQGDRAGFSVAIGDINGDGQKDILIGAPSADGPNNDFINCGEIYAITHMDWGKSSMILTESNVDLYIYGESGQKYGTALIAGNLNGDFNPETSYPIDDIIIAPKYSSIKMFFGKTSYPDKKLSTLEADWTSNYILGGRHPNMVIGDINGDGIEDLAGGDAGEVSYLTYGSTNSISTLPDVTINSPHINDNFGIFFDFSKFFSDFNGDGFQDLVILAPRAYGQFNQYIGQPGISPFVGEAHIIWGKESRLPSTIDLETDSTHFSLYGSDGSGTTGLSSNFRGAWNSTYGYVFGMELEDEGNGAELFFGDTANTYIYKINP